MNLAISLLCIVALIATIGAPPVVEKAQPADTKDKKATEDVLDNLEYSRYLKEVVDILESDSEFKKKLENASVDDIKSGNIAEHLSLVQHNVRTQLDEAKQREMTRLRELVGEKMRKLNERQRLALGRGDASGRRVDEFLPKHIDLRNSETFGQQDLERLIQHASNDLDDLDRKREQQFKEYELQKEYRRRAKLSGIDRESRQKLEQMHQEMLEKKKKHPKVNHPGSVDQMEEVWEQVDHLEAQQFKPKSFFKLHDINSDGYLDDGELEAIMLKEAEKVHDGVVEADPVEKQEELDRMRQHVMKEFDKNNDRMLSFDEFELGMRGKEAKNDLGWKSIEDHTVFSDQEFGNFSMRFSPMSTPIPRHQTSASTSPANPQPQVLPEAVAQAPAPDKVANQPVVSQ